MLSIFMGQCGGDALHAYDVRDTLHVLCYGPCSPHQRVLLTHNVEEPISRNRDLFCERIVIRTKARSRRGAAQTANDLKMSSKRADAIRRQSLTSSLFKEDRSP